MTEFTFYSTGFQSDPLSLALTIYTYNSQLTWWFLRREENEENRCPTGRQQQVEKLNSHMIHAVRVGG